MTLHPSDPSSQDSAPDIVREVLQRVAAINPAITPDQVQKVEEEVRTQFGGQRLYVNKVKKRFTPQQRQAIFKDALTTASNEEIMRSHGISRSALYLYLKKQPGA